MEVNLLEHDSTTPTTSVLTLSELAKENERLKQKVQEQQQLIETLQNLSLCNQSRFGVKHLEGSDEDIRFYTRFASYQHFQAFWQLVESAANTKMVRVTSAAGATQHRSTVSYIIRFS
ncbi:hypothetical protein R3I93_011873 [Phoxinus phoxinus]|uniref:Uncharacterized protein n=1 Tax=Phoxinus phoxinus TaxID=58324 RepID=A0AAN9CWR7_9TELE